MWDKSRFSKALCLAYLFGVCPSYSFDNHANVSRISLGSAHPTVLTITQSNIVESEMSWIFNICTV